MRKGYSRIGGGDSFSAYHLTMRDLEKIVAAHFGYDPDTIDICGLDVPSGEFSVSGRGVSLDQEPEALPSP